MRHHVRVGLDLVEEPHCLEPRHDPLARLEAVEAVQREGLVELSGSRQAFQELDVAVEVELRLDVEHVDHREMVALADLEVVEVVGRRDLHGAGALLRIGIVVGDDRDAAPDQRQHHRFADEVLVALVFGMHRDRGVAQHGLRPRRRDDDELSPIPRSDT